MKLTPLPLAASPLHVGERLRNAAAIGEELAGLLEVTHRRVVILQARIMVKSLGQEGLSQIGLKIERSFGCLPGFFPQSACGLETLREVVSRINDREERPGQRELRVQTHRLLEMLLGAERVHARGHTFQCKGEPAQIGIVRLRIFGWFGFDNLLFPAGQFDSQLIGDRLGHLGLHGKDVG